MYTVRLGNDYSLKVDELFVAISLAIQAYKDKAECEVISETTGECLLILKDKKMVYVSSAIREVV